MPRRQLVFFKESDGKVPIVDWLAGLQKGAKDKCAGRLARLEEMGHELRRPAAENLGAGIYELRAKHRGVNYRMLHFFHGTVVVVVRQGFTKQGPEVPVAELRLAARRKLEFETNPFRHYFRGTH